MDFVSESEVPQLFFGVQHTKSSYAYFTEPNGRSCKAFKNDKCHWPRGKVIGGSGALNAMLYVRGNRADYDRWCSEGCTNWCYDDVWPFFQKSTTPQGNASHPLGFVTLNHYGKFDEDLISDFSKGYAELQLPKVDDFVEGSYVGYGTIRGTIENGRRASTGKTYLSKVSQRPNLKVIKNAQVTKLEFDDKGSRVKAVEFVVQEKTPLKVNVGREAVVSSGTVDTPKLLMLSGVGPSQVLEPFKIPVLHDLPIGQNLQDHVMLTVYLRIPAATPRPLAPMESTFRYLMYNEGPLSSTGTASLVGFINANRTKSSRYPDLELLHLGLRRGDTLSMELFANGLSLKGDLKTFFMEEIDQYDIMCVLLVLAHPQSRGSIQLKSTSRREPPLIDAGYLSVPEDVDILMRGMDYLMELENTPAFRGKQIEIMQVPLEECDQFQFKSQEYWQCYAGYFSSTCFHPVGTVKMGAAHDKTSCVDPGLKVKGVHNLRVIDASIMPYVPSGNTNAPTIMIAEKAADLIKEQWMANAQVK